MVLRWTNDAVSDLEGIADYLSAKTPEHAPDILRALYEAPAKLAAFPFRGRPGREDGTREFCARAVALSRSLPCRKRLDPGVAYPARRTEMAVNIGDFSLVAALKSDLNEVRGQP